MMFVDDKPASEKLRKVFSLNTTTQNAIISNNDKTTEGVFVFEMVEAPPGGTSLSSPSRRADKTLARNSWQVLQGCGILSIALPHAMRSLARATRARFSLAFALAARARLFLARASDERTDWPSERCANACRLFARARARELSRCRLVGRRVGVAALCFYCWPTPSS